MLISFLVVSVVREAVLVQKVLREVAVVGVIKINTVTKGDPIVVTIDHGLEID